MRGKCGYCLDEKVDNCPVCQSKLELESEDTFVDEERIEFEENELFDELNINLTESTDEDTD